MSSGTCDPFSDDWIACFVRRDRERPVGRHEEAAAARDAGGQVRGDAATIRREFVEHGAAGGPDAAAAAGVPPGTTDDRETARRSGTVR